MLFCVLVGGPRSDKVGPKLAPELGAPWVIVSAAGLNWHPTVNSSFAFGVLAQAVPCLVVAAIAHPRTHHPIVLRVNPPNPSPLMLDTPCALIKRACLLSRRYNSLQ
jgi:hypothetical protein